MAEPYTQTAVPFEQLPLAALRDPVLAGPGIDGMGVAADRYRQLAETLQRAAEDLRVAMTAAQGAHEGEAAEVSRQYVERVAAVGELGAGQARIAIGALDDGAAYYSRVADDMRALHLADGPAPRSVAQGAAREQQVEDLRVLAVEAAQRYESNTNWSLGRTFQPFDPPVIAAPGTGDGVPVGGASAGGGAGAVSGSGPGVPGAGGAQTGALPVGSAGGQGAVGVGSGAGSLGPGAAGAGAGSSGNGGSVGSGAPGPVGGAGNGRVGNGRVGNGGMGSGGVVPAGPVATGPRAAGERPRDGGTGVPRTAAASVPGSSATLPGPGASGGSRSSPLPPPGSGAREPVGPGTGWIPGTPWSGRTPAEGGTSGLRAGPAEPAAPARPGAAASSSSGAQGPGTGSRSATGGTPFFPAAGAGRGEGSEHTRPSWLVEDDPQAYWFSGLPDHTAGVIGGEGDSDH